MRLATREEMLHWDELIALNPDGGNPLQSAAYGQFKSIYGWRPEHVIHELDGVTIAVLYLVHNIPGLGELWLAPKGPGVASAGQLKALLADFSAPRAFMLKIEPDLTAEFASELPKLGLQKAKYDLQWNRYTVTVDLRPSEEEILAGFKQKTRYNIRLAERKGVKIEAVPITQDNLDIMYELMRATQARAGFFMRSRQYLQLFWRIHGRDQCGQLFFATYEGQVLAGVFALAAGRQGLYKDGGSTREHPELQAPYLLQWEIMRWAKARGCTEYDLHGVPPAARIDDKTHPLAGLAQFKTGFHPDSVTEYVGVYDLPLKPSRYRFWNKAGEKIMAGFKYRIRRELFY
ncbi:MAG TPA: peptidoglycan bridge formation glycyltransferase FemA/FemB family protein [Candidatus Saccharimonadia bacterium]|jgi:lipid II:glycine glycyltransferase (peptidoglycan interpeptide bridge formation enzyme)|nr:peptidoglycan bridge formation glycyltransferase FemA/FemB family protein [Candidatus Saccharimonadia bacterium]